MFKVNEDLSIYVTRGDAFSFDLYARDKETGDSYTFRTGDLVRFKVFDKKGCDELKVQKDFRVESDSEFVTIVLDGKDTEFGEIINKPTDYWYDVKLNPDTQPQTIIGYDEDGAKLFRLYPEGGDLV